MDTDRSKQLDRQTSLVDQVFRILNQRIVNGAYPPGTKLPTGDQLAKEFDVSPSTIRMAMSRLEFRKVVQRRQGVGTFVRDMAEIPNPLDEFLEFHTLIREYGYEPGSAVQADLIKADETTRHKLHLTTGSEVLRQQKIFTADGDPIIYAVNHIPLWVFMGKISLEEALDPHLTDHFFGFFEKTCGQKISHFLSTVRAEIYRNISPPTPLINDGPETPVLVINETGYNENDVPIVHSSEFHPGNIMTFQIIRRARASL